MITKGQLERLYSKGFSMMEIAKKSRWGTLTVYVPNIKLKTIMNEWCKNALNVF